MVAQAFNPSPWEVEADGSLWGQGQAGLQKEFKDIQDYYVEKSCLRKEQKEEREPTHEVACKKIHFEESHTLLEITCWASD